MYYLRSVLYITAEFLENLYRQFMYNIFSFRLQNMKLYKCYLNNSFFTLVTLNVIFLLKHAGVVSM